MKNLEIRTIEHKGVKVRIKIDYDKGSASILNANDEVKLWAFGSRGLEYMQGWIEIVEAMMVAVKECKKELESDLERKSRFIAIDYGEKVSLPKKKK